MTRTPQQGPSYQDKVAQMLSTTEYSALSAGQINEEHDKLRAVLKDLNDQVAKMLDDMRVRHRNPTPAIERSSTELMGVRNRQIENGQAALQLYKEEYSRLNRRVYNLAERDSKEMMDKEDIELRTKIERLQLENKQMRKQTVLRGKAITVDNLSSKVRQLRQMQTEKLAVELKKVRLEEDIKKVDSELTDIRNKTSEMTSIYQQAESQIKKVEEEEKAKSTAKKNEETLQQRRALLDTLKKKHEVANAQHQQRYLLKLKDLQNSIANGNQCDEKARVAQSKILENKRQIKLMQAEVARLEAQKRSQADSSSKERPTAPPKSPPKQPPKSPAPRRNRSMDVGVGSQL